MNRRCALRTLGLGVTAGSLSTAGCLDRFTATPVVLGIYPGEDWGRIEPFERWLGRGFAVTTHYVDAAIPDEERRQFVSEEMTTQWERGRVPMVTWQPFPRESTRGSVTRAIADGSYDDVLSGWSAELAGWLSAVPDDRMFYFRPFPEMNGDWIPWGADATTIEDFVAAWRRLHGTFAEAGLTDERVQWVWNPNATEHGSHDTESYYPGDEYVDWLGIDGYNFGHSRESSSWQSPEEVFDPMFERLTDLAEKPLTLPEFGTTSYRDGRYRPEEKAAWIGDAFDYVERRGIRMACWFNIDKETDWAVFGGERGTDGYVDGDSRTYDVYGSYHDRVTTDRYVTSEGDTPISADAFRGRLD